MMRLALLGLLAWLLPAAAWAQSCPADPTSGAGPDLSATNGFSAVQQEEHSRFDLAVTVYLRSDNGLVDQEFYINDNNSGASMDVDANVGIQFASDGTIKIQRQDGLGGYEWACDAACPSYTNDTWYRFDITRDNVPGLGGYGGFVSVDITECGTGDTPTTHATAFGAPALGNKNPRRSASRLWALRATGATTIDAYGLTWTPTVSIPSCADNPCRGFSASECARSGETYQACPATTPDPLCANQTFASVDWWDWLFSAPTAKAIASGEEPISPTYSTAYFPGPGCSGVVVGPHMAMTAAHCFNDNGDPGPNLDPTQSDWRMIHLETGQEFTPDRVELHPSYGGDFGGNDVAVFYFPDTLPTPYATLFDPGTDSADCDDVVAHGFGLAAATGSQCQYEFIADFTYQGYAGYCRDPETAFQTGGDSGGPVYGVGDYGSGVEARLIGTQGGGDFYNHYNDVQEQGAWLTDRIANERPLTPAHDFGGGVELLGFRVLPDAANMDTGAGPVTLTCEFSVSGSPSYMGCVFINVNSGQRLACVDATSPFSCPVTFPQYSGGSGVPDYPWVLDKVYTLGSDVTAAALFSNGVPTAGETGIEGGDFAPDRTPIALIRTQAPKSVAPGGDAVCAARMTIGNTGEAALQNASCELYTSGEPSVVQVGVDRVSYIQQHRYVHTTLPDSATPGSTWSARIAAQDANYNSSSAELGTFTVFDCASSPPLTSNGWLGDQSIDPGAGGIHATFEFYARVTSASNEGFVVLSDQPVSDVADATHGVRFSPNGNISVLDNGGWVDTGYAYSVDLNYRFLFQGKETTAAATVNSPAYDVYVAPCGQPFALLTSNAVAHNGNRIMKPVDSWNAYADAGQSIGVSEVSFEQVECVPSQALFENIVGTWDCCDATAVDGCGGVIVDPQNCIACTGNDTCDLDPVSDTAYQCVAGPGPTGPGYFVLTGNGTVNDGSEEFTGDLGGLSSANAICLDRLTTWDWNGKATAQANGWLTSARVFAWLCDDSSYQNLEADSPYRFATTQVGLAASGGYEFTTTAGGLYPADGKNWSNSGGATDTFDRITDMFTGRTGAQGPSTGNTCSNWTSSSGGDPRQSGYTDDTGTARWGIGNAKNCGQTDQIICFVNGGGATPLLGSLEVDVTGSPSECENPDWTISPGGYSGSGAWGPTLVPNDDYTITWADSDIDCLIPQHTPTPGQETLTVNDDAQVFDLSPENYTVRASRSASVDVGVDGDFGISPAGGAPWTADAAAPFSGDYSDSGTDDGALAATLRDGRTYEVLFGAQTDYDLPTPNPASFVAQATPQVAQGDYSYNPGAGGTGGTGGGGGSNPAITPAIAATRPATATDGTGCVAPCGMLFEATGTTHTTKTEDDLWHDLEFNWDFGDPGCNGNGLFATSGKSCDAARGTVAAHVYLEPGTYTACVNVTDPAAGGNDQACYGPFTVVDPDVAFPGTSTVCVSTTGNFAGCPSGATEITSSDFDAALNTHLGNDKRVLFRGGETFFQSAQHIFSDGDEDQYVGTYGTGKAILDASGTTNVFRNSCSGANDAYEPIDFHFRDFAISGAGVLTQFGYDGGGDAHKQVTLTNLDLDGTWSGGTAGGILSGWSNSYEACSITDGVFATEFFVYQVDFPASTPTPSIRTITEAFIYSALLGNTFRDTADNDHGLRIASMTRDVISHNNWVDFFHTFGHALKWHAGYFTHPGPAGGVNEHMVMEFNNVHSRGVAKPMDLGQQGGQDERARYLQLYENMITSDDATSYFSGLSANIKAIGNICHSPTAGIGIYCSSTGFKDPWSFSGKHTYRDNYGYDGANAGVPFIDLRDGTGNECSGNVLYGGTQVINGTCSGSENYRIITTSPFGPPASPCAEPPGGSCANLDDFACIRNDYAEVCRSLP